MFKCGSDVSTQMVDKVTCIPPVNGAQAYAVMRLNLLSVLNVCRLYGIAEACENVYDHQTAQRWRNARCKRLTYVECVELTGMIMLQLEQKKPDKSSTPSHEDEVVFVPATRRVRSFKRVSLGAPSTGRTPKRCRLPTKQRKCIHSVSAYRLPRDFKSNSTAGRHDGGARGRCA